MRDYKKYFSLFIFILISSCENPSSSDELKSGEFEITYEKYGGWINPSELKISNEGLARAKVISQGLRNVIDSGQTIINEEQKKFLTNCVSVFDNYNSFYSPDKYITDQNYNIIIVRKRNTIDTVSVYHLPEANVPGTLQDFIDELESIKSEILKNENILSKINS
jgi:hypothetical protein